ncbi:hypothetical protein ACFL3G_04725 [Planctomycetota bacterium]
MANDNEQSYEKKKQDNVLSPFEISLMAVFSPVIWWLTIKLLLIDYYWSNESILAWLTILLILGFGTIWIKLLRRFLPKNIKTIILTWLLLLFSTTLVLFLLISLALMNMTW